MPTALIAEDEPLLAEALLAELRKAWPGLTLLPHAVDGDDAVELALRHLPDLLFLDIRMPGRTGLEAAQTVVEEWPADRPLPLIVFITAYDQYALQAFEASAVDYLLKPVQAARLGSCCQRLRALLAGRQTDAAATDEQALLLRLRSLLTQQPAQQPAQEPPLTVLQAGVGNTVHMVPIHEVIYFEAADKYVRVITAQREHLIRISLRELLPRLDEQRFWQVHRGVVVRADAIASATRDDTGKVELTLRDRSERLPVSRLYAARFKGM
jgi:DNA-binding LytR/AlgR family response regulator